MNYFDLFSLKTRINIDINKLVQDKDIFFLNCLLKLLFSYEKNSKIFINFNLTFTITNKYLTPFNKKNANP